jgi:peptidoglycan/LPS O-acetylase OafA/YrhL
LRIEQLTFTRFIAAIAIVIFHYGKDSWLFNNEHVLFIFRNANLGVSYFFILSGFVMIIAYGYKSRVSFIDFIKNRVARIYPVYILAILLLLANNHFAFPNKGDLLLNCLMLQAWVPGKALTINYPGWSLSVELFFYILFPISYNRIYSKLNFKTLATLIISFWVMSQIVFHLLVVFHVINISFYSDLDIHYNPLMHLNQFLAGNLAGLYFLKFLVNKQGNYTIPIVSLLATLLVILKYSNSIPDYHNGLLCVIFVPLIIFIALNKSMLTGFFSKPFFIFLGEISFGIYILQYSIWNILSDHRMLKFLKIDPATNTTVCFFVRLLILIAFAAISYLIFEKPLRNLIKGLKLPGNYVPLLK